MGLKRYSTFGTSGNLLAMLGISVICLPLSIGKPLEQCSLFMSVTTNQDHILKGRSITPITEEDWSNSLGNKTTDLCREYFLKYMASVQTWWQIRIWPKVGM